MTDCCCGNPEGTNAECERCRLLAEIVRLRESRLGMATLAEAVVKDNIRTFDLLVEVADCGIERTADGKYHCVQIPCELWLRILVETFEDKLE